MSDAAHPEAGRAGVGHGRSPAAWIITLSFGCRLSGSLRDPVVAWAFLIALLDRQARHHARRAGIFARISARTGASRIVIPAATRWAFGIAVRTPRTIERWGCADGAGAIRLHIGIPWKGVISATQYGLKLGSFT